MTEFYSLLQAGSDLIAADWLEELDVEYYTEIARQLRGEHGEWLADRLFYGKSFNCWVCKLQLAYGYKFHFFDGNEHVKTSLYLFCTSCRDIQISLNAGVGGSRLKVQAI